MLVLLSGALHTPVEQGADWGCSCGQLACCCEVRPLSCAPDVDNYSGVTTRCSGNRTPRPLRLTSERDSCSEVFAGLRKTAGQWRLGVFGAACRRLLLAGSTAPLRPHRPQ